MFTRRSFFSGAGLAVAATAVGKSALAALPEIVSTDSARHADTAGAAQRPPLPPGRDLERLEPALAHAQRRQGISSGRRARDPRDRARHAGTSLGLQRAIAGPDHRSGRGRPRPHLRHQPPAGAHQHSLAWPAPAERHGRRVGSESAAHQARADLCVRIRGPAGGNLHVPPARR